MNVACFLNEEFSIIFMFVLKLLYRLEACNFK